MLRPALVLAALLLVLPLRPGAAGEVTLRAGDLFPLGQGRWLAAGLELPAPDPALPLLGPGLPPDAARLLRRHAARGAAHGFGGLLYDNRDRGHSALSPERFPRLARLAYGPALRERNADYGLAGAILLPAIVLGNSSTAITAGPAARSLPRLAMTSDTGPAASARLYRSDALYVYPEHRDHDAADRFPANWPYTVISQGSSGSDRAFLQALALTLAAFRPETMAALREHRLVAPALQAILRRNLAPVRRPADYLTGAAHPVVFDAADLRPGRMVGHAAAMAADAIPPRVRLEVVEETFGGAAGLAGRSERLFDTPQAVARVWRGFAWEQTMRVSAARTTDPNGRALTFSWRLLQGDPERVEIAPLDPAGRQARLTIRWHDPWSVPAPRAGAPAGRRLSRVDIGVFADNGAEMSAPAFVSVSFPAHQIRRYEEATPLPRLAAIDYDAIGREAPYDPLLHWSAPWTDTAQRDAAGTLTGWRRRHADGRVTEIPVSAAAYRIDATDPAHPVLAEPPE
jgi:hypothetical protein